MFKVAIDSLVTQPTPTLASPKQRSFFALGKATLQLLSILSSQSKSKCLKVRVVEKTE